MTIECIKEYLPLVESLFVILGVIFIAFQIRQQKRISRADHDRRMKQSTIEFYNLISAQSYQFLDDIKGRTLDLSTVNSDKALRKSVIRYLSRLERLAIGVASHTYDFKILCVMSGRFLSKKYDQFEKYINEARTAKDAPLLYKEFELLVDRINEYRKKHPNQIVDKTFYIKLP